jgi:hypothetical protein
LTLTVGGDITIGRYTVVSQEDSIVKAEISQVIHKSIGWALTKDKDLLYRSVAKDSDFFIFHPDSNTIVGFEAFRELVEGLFMHKDFKATDYAIRDLRINVSRSGETAWYAAVLDDFGEWQGRPTIWKDARWTGVLEKRDCDWVIVQMHFSFASDTKK